MKWRFWSCIALVVVFVGVVLSAWLSAIFGRMVRTAHAEKLPPNFVYMKTGASSVPVEKAYFASAYGGWHGDGSEMTAYKIRSADVPALLTGLRTKYSAYRWEEHRALHSDVWYLAKQVPAEFRPADNARLLHGMPGDGSGWLEFYFDRQLEVLFVVSSRS